ncbi:MAG: adventurous gliding motility lipoprotein CglC [Myxococcales bacterium]
MFRLLVPALVLIAVGGGLGACQLKTDLAQPCKMTRPDENGKPQEIEAAKLKDPTIDYVALGAAECDDLVCIRSARTDQNPENEASGGRGYCTRPCIDDADCQFDYQGNEGRLKCERLLLDQAFLDQLKQSDPEAYEQAFGSDTASRYCVFPRQQ